MCRLPKNNFAINWFAQKYLRDLLRVENKVKTRFFGIKKDVKDPRDYKLLIPFTSLPEFWSLKQYCPPIKNQQNIGSCASNAYCTALEILRNIKGEKVGGHAMVLIGYDTDIFEFVNSWGISWGFEGYNCIKENDLMNNLIDAWAIK